MSKVLIVDDEPADVGLVCSALEKMGHEVVTAMDADTGIDLARMERPDVAVLDVMLPDQNGLDLLKTIQEIDDRMPVIFVTSSSDSGTAIQAMKLGAMDYLVKPIDVVALRKVVDKAVEIRRLTQKPVEMNVDVESPDAHAIIGKCAAMQEVYKAIGIVANKDVTVLIRGESGTGKELVARALYQFSDRVRGPFLAVNCAAIPETLLESELFGHEKGAFTGADRKRIGKFEQAEGGTLFLDEIGDMSPVLQSKLLRVLQERKFERVGGNDAITADVRVIAATHCPLEQMVAKGQFRADLYYRLNGFSIHLPPVRDRGEDLESLVEHFRRLSCVELKRNVQEISREAMELLRDHHWPGNVRELQNVVRQAILKTKGPVLLADFLPDLMDADDSLQTDRSIQRSLVGEHGDGALRHWVQQQLDSESKRIYDDAIEQFEHCLVTAVLDQTDGDRTKAAMRLGINPATLRSQAALELMDLNADAEHGNHVPLIRPGMTLEEIEKMAIVHALDQTGGCRKEAANRLGISVRTIQRRVKELDLP
ncbi:MAG: sigma 54-interacting transcriptional regulator [Pirellulaceae bacterium]|nr:sigma 54-interacting transcriptional regulator [Pirellulaceae bacterium]